MLKPQPFTLSTNIIGYTVRDVYNIKMYINFRFWKCHVTKKDDVEFEYTWNEWEMMNKDQESTIDIPGCY